MDRKGLHKAEYDQMYINTMRPIFDKKALFTDMTEDYVNPPEPSAYGQVTIKFRTKKNNVDRVLFVCDNEKHLMLKRESDSYFDYYFHTVQLEDREISYYFEIHFDVILMKTSSKLALPISKPSGSKPRLCSSSRRVLRASGLS